MSAFYALVDDLKEHLKIKNYILARKGTEEKFIVMIYCKEGDINVNEELNYFNTLLVKHSFGKMGHQPFE